jgi:hypothetical protein
MRSTIESGTNPIFKEAEWSIAGQDKLLDPVDSPGFKDGTGKAYHADQ